jgi:hypothetical protein
VAAGCCVGEGCGDVEEFVPGVVMVGVVVGEGGSDPEHVRLMLFEVLEVFADGGVEGDVQVVVGETGVLCNPLAAGVKCVLCEDGVADGELVVVCDRGEVVCSDCCDNVEVAVFG